MRVSHGADGCRRREAGSVTIVAAGVMVLAAVLALATADLLRVLEVKAEAQTAADAAALAAAGELAVPSGRPAADWADEYATRDGASLLECRCDPGTWEAVVTVEKRVRLLFLGSDRAIRAAARAVVEGGEAGAG